MHRFTSPWNKEGTDPGLPVSASDRYSKTKMSSLITPLKKLNNVLSSLTWALGRQLLRLFGRPEEDRLTGGAAASHADALHVNDVLRVLIQIPQCTGARGGVHFLDEPQHSHILLLQTSREEKSRGQEARCNMKLYRSLRGKYSFLWQHLSREVTSQG